MVASLVECMCVWFGDLVRSDGCETSYMFVHVCIYISCVCIFVFVVFFVCYFCVCVWPICWYSSEGSCVHMCDQITGGTVYDLGVVTLLRCFLRAFVRLFGQ